jgi:hypothetical protein
MPGAIRQWSETKVSQILRWEVATGKELPALEVQGASGNTSCLLSPDGGTLLVWCLGKRNQQILADPTTGKIRHRLEDNRGWRGLPAFSSDGRTVAMCESGGISLWEVANGRQRGRLALPLRASAPAFSLDGRLLALGSNSETPVLLWDLAAGRIVGQLRAEFGQVMSLAFSPDSSRLAVAGFSPMVLVCDVATLCDKKRIEEIGKITEPSAEELEGLWAELTGTDGARAYRAIRQLGLTGPRGAAFLKVRLKGDKPPDARRIARLIADLDDDKFATREKSYGELEKLGVRAEPALRRALEGEASLEVRTRVKRLLDRLGAAQEPLPSPELVRLRVVEALEANGTPEARKTLAELATAPAESELAREAKASLGRLSRRPAPKP